MATSGAYTVKTVGEAWTIVHAAATDHANRRMRKAGRAAWNAEDDQAHTDHLYHLLGSWGFWDAKRDQPTALYFTMRADRSAPFVIEQAA